MMTKAEWALSLWDDFTSSRQDSLTNANAWRWRRSYSWTRRQFCHAWGFAVVYLVEAWR